MARSETYRVLGMPQPAIVLLLACVTSVLLGLLQLAQGPDSPLRFFEFTNNTEAVGFFANRNHFAALCYSGLLFAAAWLVNATIDVGLRSRRKAVESTAVLVFAVCLLAFLALIVAQLMARSRAGLGISIVALLASLSLGLADRRAIASSASTAKITLGSAAIAIVFSLQFALYRILDRFGADPFADARIPYARNTIAAAKAYMPFGSGMGTFVPVYQIFEQPSDVAVAYANHAHNDALELWLEAGAAGIVLFGVFLFWLLRQTLKAWRQPNLPGASDIDRGLTRAAAFVVILILAHSLVDYPLRTSAMAAVAAFACGLLIPPRVSQADLDEYDEAQMRKRSNFARNVPRPKAPPGPGQFPDPQSGNMPPPIRPRVPWGQNVEWPESWRPPHQRGPKDPGKKSD